MNAGKCIKKIGGVVIMLLMAACYETEKNEDGEDMGTGDTVLSDRPIPEDIPDGSGDMAEGSDGFTYDCDGISVRILDLMLQQGCCTWDGEPDMSGPPCELDFIGAISYRNRADDASGIIRIQKIEVAFIDSYATIYEYPESIAPPFIEISYLVIDEERVVNYYSTLLRYLFCSSPASVTVKITYSGGLVNGCLLEIRNVYFSCVQCL